MLASGALPGRNDNSNSNEGSHEVLIQSAVHSISLPKGGAVRGMGVKSAVNPATGTNSLTIPIATSLGCSDLGLQLLLSYDYGPGDGLFGLG